MKRRKLIRDGWLQYAEHVLPQGASAVQTRETRQAFYAGAGHLWGAFIAALGPGEEADPPDLALAGDVQAEIDEFLALVRRGRG